MHPCGSSPQTSSSSWQPVCKLGTGFTDEILVEWHAHFTTGKGSAGYLDVTAADVTAGVIAADVTAGVTAGAAALPSWLDVAEGGLSVGFTR